MHVLIRNEAILFEGVVSTVSELNQKLINEMNRGQLFINSVLIDGVEIEGDVEQYIKNNAKQINYVEIELVHYDRFLAQTMKEGEQYLSRVLPDIEKLADEFYKGAGSDTWVKLGQLSEGIQWLLQLAQTINYGIKEMERRETDSIIESLSEQVLNIVEAMQQGDQVLLGDYLLYEVIPVFVRFNRLLANTIATGDIAYDRN